METFRKYQNIIFICLLFGIIYSLTSLVNHYYFRTYALDLGAYTNALFDYSHLQWNDSSVFKEVEENILADHFDFYLILFSPLSFIFGTYTLLIVQIVAVLFGGVGIYQLFNLNKKTSPLAIYATLYYFIFFGTFSAFSFDYHSNVVAAAMVPWFFYLVAKKKLLKSSILLVLIIVSKENTPLWLAFICFGLAIEYRKTIVIRNYLIAASVFSFISFLLITSVFMPAISNDGNYAHFHYSYLGNNFSEALFNIILHPIDSLSMLFTNHTNHPNGDFVKLELHILLLVSGLLILLKKPQYLIMLIPIYFQKLFHDNFSMWGINAQYNIEFAPIMAIGIFMVVSEFKRGKLIKYSSILILVLTTAATIRTMDNTILFTDKSRLRIYQKGHYQRDYNVKEIHLQINKIPVDAIVSAQSPFVPHLALRESIYQFPIIKDAEYIVYSKMENTYPLSQEDFEILTAKLEGMKEWKIVYNDEVTILKRNTEK